MAKVYAWLVTMVGLMILLNLAGISTASSFILSQLNIFNPESFKLSTFFITISGIIAGITASALVIGYITKSSSESFLLTGYMDYLFLFVADMISIYVYLNSNYCGWIANIGMLIALPLVVGYIHSIISWWGGKEGG